MRENAGASRFSVPLPPALAPQGEAHQCRGNPITGRGRIRRETCHSRSSKWLQKPGLCVHRADGAGHCDHWAVIELGERDLVRAGELSLGGGKEGDKGKGRQSQQTRGGGSGPALRMSCVEWPRSLTPLHTFRVLWVAEGWLPVTHVLRSPIQPPHLVPPKNDKIISGNIPDERKCVTVTLKTL